MFAMFAHAEKFNQPLENWDVSKVTDMFGMFNSAVQFNQPLGDWNVSQVTEHVLDVRLCREVQPAA